MKVRYLLKEIREKKGLSKAGLAKLIGIKHPTIIRIEKCQLDGSIETWQKIQTALKIPSNQMWAIITETKYIKSNIEASEKNIKIENKAD